MKPQVISFHYNLTDKTGKPIESSRKGEPLICLEGAGQILPGLEQALSTLKKGEKKTVNLAAVEAYGEHDAKLIIKVPKDQLPPADGGGELKKGFQFQSETPEGHLQIFTVTEVQGSQVTLDGNHPLAGQDLTFDVEVMERRDATEEELEHGHAHGGDGHHHH
jgi:FKBP-type peptidyl-prolyl cis-trans isomerase SlyD